MLPSKQHTTMSHIRNAVFLSDKVGKGLGPLLSQELRGDFINICSPGSNYSNLVHKANSIEFNELFSLVILCGNSLSLGKRELLLNVQIGRAHV